MCSLARKRLQKESKKDQIEKYIKEVRDYNEY
jgi:hypothetical protein